jgi:hypothetical protein
MDIAVRPRIPKRPEQRLADLFSQPDQHVQRVKSEQLERAWFGRELTDGEIHLLAGAPRNAAVLLEGPRQSNGTDDYMTLRVTGAYTREQLRHLFRDASNGKMWIKNSGLEVHPVAPRSYGTASLAAQVVCARSLGLDCIELFASGWHGDTRNGYYSFARMGFEADLKPNEIKVLRELAPGAKTVQDLMTIGEPGREWWREYGTGRKMVFSLRDESRSLNVLRAYLRERQIPMEV